MRGGKGESVCVFKRGVKRRYIERQTERDRDRERKGEREIEIG